MYVPDLRVQLCFILEVMNLLHVSSINFEGVFFGLPSIFAVYNFCFVVCFILFSFLLYNHDYVCMYDYTLQA